MVGPGPVRVGFSGRGVDDRDVEVGHEDQDASSGVFAAHADLAGSLVLADSLTRSSLTRLLDHLERDRLATRSRTFGPTPLSSSDLTQLDAAFVTLIHASRRV